MHAIAVIFVFETQLFLTVCNYVLIYNMLILYMAKYFPKIQLNWMSIPLS